MSADLPSAAYPSPDSAARFYEAVVQRLQAVPGVEQASVSQGLPLQGVQWGEGLRVPGIRESLLVRLKLVDPWYFGALQIPVETGRGIEDRDRAGVPLAAVSVVVGRSASGTADSTATTLESMQIRCTRAAAICAGLACAFNCQLCRAARLAAPGSSFMM